MRIAWQAGPTRDALNAVHFVILLRLCAIVMASAAAAEIPAVWVFDLGWNASGKGRAGAIACRRKNGFFPPPFRS